MSKSRVTRHVRHETPPSSSGRVVEDHDDFRELEEGLRIDEHALDEALRDHPEMFNRVAKALALEISRRDRAKQAHQDAEFKADLMIRARAEVQDKKMTESEVRARVNQSEDVIFRRDILLRLNESVGLLSALKEAFQARSYALKELVELYVSNYYSASEHTTGINAARDQAAAHARTRMSEERRRL